MKSSAAVLVLCIALLVVGAPAYSQTFTLGTYQSKDSDGLTSSMTVSNLSAGMQQLSEDSNSLLHLGGPSCQANIKDFRIVPKEYNQSDLLNGQLVSCVFSNCSGIPPCTPSDVTVSPGKYYKQGSDQICAAWQDGQSKCYTMIDTSVNMTIDGVTLHKNAH